MKHEFTNGFKVGYDAHVLLPKGDFCRFTTGTHTYSDQAERTITVTVPEEGLITLRCGNTEVKALAVMIRGGRDGEDSLKGEFFGKSCMWDEEVLRAQLRAHARASYMYTRDCLREGWDPFAED